MLACHSQELGLAMQCREADKVYVFQLQAAAGLCSLSYHTLLFTSNFITSTEAGLISKVLHIQRREILLPFFGALFSCISVPQGLEPGELAAL